jgi:hypothetical protein
MNEYVRWRALLAHSWEAWMYSTYKGMPCQDIRCSRDRDFLFTTPSSYLHATNWRTFHHGLHTLGSGTGTLIAAS